MSGTNTATTDGSHKWILDRGKVIEWADDGPAEPGERRVES
ncbi:MAG: hypothetical protein V1897_16125 [Pseudomonadota bacterium]